MRKNIFGRQFKRDRNERQSLFKGLISSLVLEEKIKTTEQKAKAIKADIDKMVTHAKKGESARRLLQSRLLGDAVEKAILDIGPRFAKRHGGYTRITRIGRRLSDNASMVLMEFVEKDKDLEPKTENAKPKLADKADDKKSKKLQDKNRLEKNIQKSRKISQKADSKK